MKIAVRKLDLIEALDRVKATVATNKMIKLLTCFAFKDGKLLAYNGQSGTITDSPLGEMSFAVERDIFYKIIAKMYDEIEITQKDNHIIIKSGSNKTQLQTIAAHDYPDFLPKKSETFCTASNLVSCLERVSFTMGVNQMKPQLLGACISNNHVYSSDGQRVSRSTLNGTASGSVTIPAASVEHICKLGLADELLVEKNTSGAISRVSFYYSATNTIYTTAALAYDFPTTSVDKILSVPPQEEYLTEFPEDLPITIDRVTLLSTEESGLVFSNEPGKGLRVHGMVKEVGEADEVIPWDFPHEFRFAARADRVKKAFERTRKVDLSNVIVGNKQSVRFSDEGFDTVMALIMLTD